MNLIELLYSAKHMQELLKI
uniref:Uncharacterized protein n=1 Tax=Arundo donax TaxID=35708 RepID=A0A0A9G094_ARUDO